MFCIYKYFAASFLCYNRGAEPVFIFVTGNAIRQLRKSGVQLFERRVYFEFESAILF